MTATGSIPRDVDERAVILFDVDGTLISTGGAGARSWRWAFDRLYGIPADIQRFSETGMTDPVVGRSTFRGVLGREPTSSELSRLLAAYLRRLPREVTSSLGYRVLPGAEPLLRRLSRAGHLLGIVTGALERAARVKLARGELNRFFAFGGFGSDSDDRVELTSKAIERAGARVLDGVEPRSVFVVGDTPRDVEAALGVGAVPIGVASGRYDAPDLLRAGAVDVVSSLAQPIPAFGFTSG
jgi:phosphoglycolate phosphatase-like HAD superfamily hydrolase